MAAAVTLKPYVNGFEPSFTLPSSTTDVAKRVNRDPSQSLVEEAERLKRKPPIVNVDAWPQHFDSPMAWTGQDFRDSSTYTYYLSPDEVLEIDSGLEHFQGPYSNLHLSRNPLQL